METIKDFLKDNINYLTIFLGVLLIIGAEVLSSYYFYRKSLALVDSKEDISNFLVNEESKQPEIYKVDIKGEVNKPGTYEVDASKRVIDVIALADGLTKNADTRANNLSLKVYDEMVIVIYSKEQISKFKQTMEEENLIMENCQKMINGIQNNSCIEKENSTSNNNGLSIKEDKISINKASVDELMKIPGIGSSKAESIVKYRNTNGDFKSIEQIKNVDGIGEGLYAKIKDYITL